jgi:hypothetical protein
MYKTIAITDLELFIHMISRGTKPHEALINMIEHDQKLKHTRQYLIAMIDDIDKSEDK